MSKIIIYHPSKYLGGTEILFSRVIDLLISQGCRDINVIDFCDGILSVKLKRSDVNYHNVDSYNRKELLESATLISSARNIARVILECKKNDIVKIKPLFWLLHPSELYSGYCLGSTFLKRIGYKYLNLYLKILPAVNTYKNLIHQLDKNSNLWIMDDACRWESEWAFKYTFRSKVVLPLITNLDYSSAYYGLNLCGRKILILSRLDDFKTHGIVKLIDDIIEYNHSINNKLSISIIGDGPSRDDLEKRYRNIDGLTIKFLGYVDNAGLAILFRKENYSLLFAMGTSALEGASRGIPTVLLPSSDRKIKNRDNVYRYLHDSNGYSLGEYINTPFESDGYGTFGRIIGRFEANREDLIQQTIEYFMNNYGKDITQSNFIQTLTNLEYLSVDEINISKVFEFYTIFIKNKRLHSGV